MVDKQYCMSSYLAFRYIEDNERDFYEGLRHKVMPVVPEEGKTSVKSAEDIDRAIQAVFDRLSGQHLGILLSGGMDSACLASYMPGADAYTFRFLGGAFQTEELARAEYFADRYQLTLHYVDIDWHTVEDHLEPVMRAKAAPVHSIEPQIYQAALQAKADGVERVITGASADLIFGGMDQLLSKDWSFDAFVDRYTFLQPSAVLKEPMSMVEPFERYRILENEIDFQGFLNDVSLAELSSSYWNAFTAADIPYTDPYAALRKGAPLDLLRIRSGEPKYLIRQLFSMKYPEIPVPNKNPMPRPVDAYFQNWHGPVRPEFKKDLDMSAFTGNQKWQMYCLERFLNLYEPYHAD